MDLFTGSQEEVSSSPLVTTSQALETPTLHREHLFNLLPSAGRKLRPLEVKNK